MFRSRCALQNALRGTNSSKIVYRLEGVLSVKDLRTSQVFLCAMSTQACAFATTSSVKGNNAGQTTLTSNAQTLNSVRGGSQTAAAAATSEKTLFQPHTHENVFAHQVTAALSSFFPTSRLTEKTLADKVAETAEYQKDVAMTSNLAEQLAAEAFSDDGASGFATGSANSLVSYGEEEIQENREQPAQDMANPDEAIQTISVNNAQQTTAESSHGTCVDRRSRPLHRNRGSSQNPVNLQGALYLGDMAAVLQVAAHARYFVSPFWTSKAAFERIGATVDVPEDEGVLLPISSARSIRVFNLEQTSLAEQFRMATVAEVQTYVRGHHPWSVAPTTSLRPRNIAGGALPRVWVDALAASPNFFVMQGQCPYWILSKEMRSLNVEPRAEEADNYFLIPALRGGFAGPASAGSWWSPRWPADATASASLHKDEETDKEGEMHIFNLKQVSDDDGRFAQFSLPLEKMARCYSIRGTCYSPVTTWLMWEYCRRYHFPLNVAPIVMLTAERVHSMGGTVLQTPRHPLPARSSPVVEGVGEETDATADPASSNDDSDKEGATAVVPPPFTILINEEVVTLYNALQTDISSAIFERVKRQRENRFQGKFVKSD